MQFTIDNRLRRLIPQLSLGLLTATVTVAEHVPDLWSDIERYIEELKCSESIDNLTSIPEIRAVRNGYRAIGKDPSRYRPSQEALLRRVLKGKGLFKINSVVDINNLISLQSRHSLGSYDLDQTKGPITFRTGLKNESYKGIGKEAINLEGLPVFCDDLGAFGSPTSDSERTMVTLTTTRVLMVIISFTGNDGLDTHINSAANLLKIYANGEIDGSQRL